MRMRRGSQSNRRVGKVKWGGECERERHRSKERTRINNRYNRNWWSKIYSKMNEIKKENEIKRHKLNNKEKLCLFNTMLLIKWSVGYGLYVFDIIRINRMCVCSHSHRIFQTHIKWDLQYDKFITVCVYEKALGCWCRVLRCCCCAILCVYVTILHMNQLSIL